MTCAQMIGQRVRNETTQRAHWATGFKNSFLFSKKNKKYKIRLTLHFHSTSLIGSKEGEMPLSATVVGAVLGLSVQLHSNALRKLPLMRHPWEHVLAIGIGAVFGNQLVKWEAKVEEDLDKLLEKAKAANERRYIDADED
ncbi:unnamed protein product, partial [Vitis vinifera]